MKRKEVIRGRELGCKVLHMVEEDSSMHVVNKTTDQ